MEPEEGKVSVWVCREEKLVSGLTRRTTCAEMVQVLLEDQNLQQGDSAAMLSGSPESYCVVEKWRGFERTLPNKTKILRLWSAWGAEQHNVRFVLVKSDASLPNNGPRSAEARVVQSRESGGPLRGSAAANLSQDKQRPSLGQDKQRPSLGQDKQRPSLGQDKQRPSLGQDKQRPSLGQDKQRRIVKKAFRKLEQMKKKEQVLLQEQDSVDRMETLVHLVISQDHTIRQQVQRIRELDRDIEQFEAQVHLDRVQRHGLNYVQDTYMLDASSSSSSSSAEPPAPERQDALAQFEEYARRCEEVVRLQEELTEREALLESIAGEIQEELNRRWMERRREESGGEAEEPAPSSSSAPPAAEPEVQSLSEDELLLEEERVRTQLDTSLYIGLRLKTDLDSLRGDLDLSLALWETRESELLDLLAKVETTEVQQANRTGAGPEEPAATGTEVQPGPGGWVEQARGLAKVHNDEDSDTGLSSMHSQDSDNPPVCESLV